MLVCERRDRLLRFCKLRTSQFIPGEVMRGGKRMRSLQVSFVDLVWVLSLAAVYQRVEGIGSRGQDDEAHNGKVTLVP